MLAACAQNTLRNGATLISENIASVSLRKIVGSVLFKHFHQFFSMIGWKACSLSVQGNQVGNSRQHHREWGPIWLWPWHLTNMVRVGLRVCRGECGWARPLRWTSGQKKLITVGPHPSLFTRGLCKHTGAQPPPNTNAVRGAGEPGDLQVTSTCQPGDLQLILTCVSVLQTTVLGTYTMDLYFDRKGPRPHAEKDNTK